METINHFMREEQPKKVFEDNIKLLFDIYVHYRNTSLNHAIDHLIRQMGLYVLEAPLLELIDLRLTLS